MPEWRQTKREELALLITCTRCLASPTRWCLAPQSPWSRDGWDEASPYTLVLHPERMDAMTKIYLAGAEVGVARTLATVGQLHYRVPPTGDPTGDPDDDHCSACEVTWPCPTMVVAVSVRDEEVGNERRAVPALLVGGPLDGEQRHVRADETHLQLSGQWAAHYRLRVDQSKRPRLSKYGWRCFDYVS